jgi:hypothetical protein
MHSGALSESASALEMSSIQPALYFNLDPDSDPDFDPNPEKKTINLDLK